MDSFEDMLDWIVEQPQTHNPLEEIADAYAAALLIMKDNPTHVKMNDSTYSTYYDAFKAEVGYCTRLTHYGDMRIIIDNSLPDYVYKFD